jgi:oligopeptide/dipeptide ABC transporter ATP-binding protein
VNEVGRGVSTARPVSPAPFTAAEAAEPLVQVRDLQKHFAVGGAGWRSSSGGTLRAVDGVSLDIRRGETLGLVGESGCGKTTLGKVILRLVPPTGGDVMFRGTSVFGARGDELKAIRRRMQIIYQDPYSSLDPRMTVGDIVGEGPQIHGLGNRRDRDELVAALLARVGLSGNYVRRYPHEFSGGQRQRIGIARALALNPEFVVCDEPVSALDVSIQSQVLNLLRDLQAEMGLTYLFIAHNLAVVEHISNRVGVMYLGRVAELGNVDDIYADPRHPYTVALLSAVPEPDPHRRKRRLILRGDVPSPMNIPCGCRFHTRCWLREALGRPVNCENEDPPLRELAAGHQAACHWAERITPATIDAATRGIAAASTGPDQVDSPGRASR